MVAVVDSLALSLNFKVATSAARTTIRILAKDPITDNFRISGLYTATQAISVHQMHLVTKILLCCKILSLSPIFVQLRVRWIDAAPSFIRSFGYLQSLGVQQYVPWVLYGMSKRID